MPSKDHEAFRRAAAASAAQPALIEIGKRIDELARELGGQRAAARVAGKHYNQIANYVRGENEPGVLAMVALAGDRDVSLDWLLAGIGPKRRHKGAVPLDVLQTVVEEAEAFLRRERLTLDPPKKAQLIATLCQLVADKRAHEPNAPIDISEFSNVIRLVR